jgi:archaellum component FlaC
MNEKVKEIRDRVDWADDVIYYSYGKPELDRSAVEDIAVLLSEIERLNKRIAELEGRETLVGVMLNEKVKELKQERVNFPSGDGQSSRWWMKQVDFLISEIERLERQNEKLQKQLEYVASTLEVVTKENDERGERVAELEAAITEVRDECSMWGRSVLDKALSRKE